MDPLTLMDVRTLVGAALHAVLAVSCTVHVLLTKESSRATIGWVGLVWLSPVLGSLVYLVLGINRVARKGVQITRQQRALVPFGRDPADDALDEPLPGVRGFLDRITDEPLVSGNRAEVLEGGAQTYPAMITAIDAATHTIAMQTFILQRDDSGRAILDALIRAHERGVAVRLLIDGVGVFFSWPPPLDWLRALPFPWARFLWTLHPGRMALLNLRTHRKILVVDGRVAFTGGMNIRGSFVASHDHPDAHRDVHARIEGPAARRLLAVFAVDWEWTTGEVLDGEAWFPSEVPEAGDVAVRVVPDGPDEDLGDAEMSFTAGLACAQHHVRIATPYFLPEERLVASLIAAAHRGVIVDVVLPAHNNQPLAHHAMMGSVRPLLEHGVRVWLDPGPFDHAKIMVVDQAWSVLGSANWDPRSLRLNFELNVEIWSEQVASALAARVDAHRDASRPLQVHALVRRPLTARLRDAAVRLLAPYL